MRHIVMMCKFFALNFLLIAIIYPLITLAIGQLFFKEQSNASLIKRKDQIIGSELIGQKLNSAKYFHIRTDSASGIDPDASPQFLMKQIERVASARKISQEKLKKIIDKHVVKAKMGIFGQDRVNVLMLNLELDNLQ